MRADAIPVRPLRSQAVLSPAAMAEAFGAGATLGPSATVEIVRQGQCLGRIPVVRGDALALTIDATLGDLGGPVHVRGPVGAVGPVRAAAARSCLVVPDGLRRAWGLGDTATLGLGAVAVAVPVEAGAEVRAEIDAALWLGSGRPETARWLAHVALAAPVEEDDADDAQIERRVITENDVRQARRQRRRIRLRPGQIVTPAARSLAHEWNVFEDDER